jgi:hypothetical protein
MSSDNSNNDNQPKTPASAEPEFTQDEHTGAVQMIPQGVKDTAIEVSVPEPEHHSYQFVETVIQPDPETVTPFPSQGALMAAIRDPRYRRDASYRALVEARIAATS